MPYRFRIDSPAGYELAQNYPQSLQPYHHDRVRVAGCRRHQLLVYNILGEKVKTLVDRRLAAGSYTAGVGWYRRNRRPGRQRGLCVSADLEGICDRPGDGLVR